MHRVIEIPEPIGDYFCHRHLNGTVEHHETKWIKGFAHCKRCDLSAEVSLKSLHYFLNDESLIEQLVSVNHEEANA